MKYEHLYEIRPLFDVLGAMSPEFAETEQPDNMLYVATYASPMYGAGAIGHPDFIEDAAVVMRGSFFILPSSIHDKQATADEASSMTNQITQPKRSKTLSLTAPA